jgi:hypothetical protein
MWTPRHVNPDDREAMVALISISEAGRRLGKSKNLKLLRALLRHHDIPTQRVGNADCIDEDGLKRLKEALDAWENRPRVSRMAMSV